MEVTRPAHWDENRNVEFSKKERDEYIFRAVGTEIEMDERINLLEDISHNLRWVINFFEREGANTRGNYRRSFKL